MPGGRLIVNGTCWAMSPANTCAFVMLVSWMWLSWLVGVLAFVVAVMVTCRCPAPSGTTLTPTGGRGLQVWSSGAAGATGEANCIPPPMDRSTIARTT
jgi:hypothetical protein